MGARFIIVVLAFAFGISGAAGADSPSNVIACYRKLSAAAIEAKLVSTEPEIASFHRIDVSKKARSASFGHTTTLLVSPTDDTFYVEYGRSTNKPRRLFGPFSVE